MEATALVRTGSGRFHFPSTPAEHHLHHHDLPALSRTRSAGAAGFSTRSTTTTTTVHLDKTRHQQQRQPPLPNTLRRAASCDFGSTAAASSFLHGTNTGSPSILGLGASSSGGRSGSSYSARSALLDEELDLEFSGGGSGRGSRIGGGGRPGDGSGNRNRGMGEYYREMLRADPENPLLLINYGKFLHEVEGDLQAAEDCFGRAVLASPTDGEALSLYGNLLWEAHGDDHRADDYLKRAVQAAPDDCYVLGSYANFLWDAKEEEEEEEEELDQGVAGSTPASSSSPMAAENAIMA